MERCPDYPLFHTKLVRRRGHPNATFDLDHVHGEVAVDAALPTGDHAASPGFGHVRGIPEEP
jgi:hypothetical protein